MSGQDSWYNVQQPQYPPFTAQSQQQQQQQQQQPHAQRPLQHLPQQHPQLEHQYMQHASTSYHNGRPVGIAEQPYQAISYTNQSARGLYGAGQSGGDPPLQASGAYSQSMNGQFLSLQGMQQSSPTSSGATDFSRRESTGQYPQSSAYQQYHGGEKPPSATSHLQRQSIDFTSLASPVQHRFYPNAAPSQQQQHPFAQPIASPSGNATPQHQLQRPHAAASQHVYESPYAPSTGTRERLAMSQSPMSDVFQSGAPTMGRTFNMMAGLETPTPNPPLRRISAQSYAGDHPDKFSPNLGHHPQASASSLQGHWTSLSNGNGQQHSPWPAAESSLASWNSTAKPYPSMQPLPTQSSAASFPPRNLSVDSRNASHFPSNTAPRTSLSDATPASVHADSYPAPPSSGSSLDAAWRAPYPRSSSSAQAPHSAQSMAHSRHIPHLIEPGSPTLSLARKSSHASPLHAQPPLPSLFGPSGSSTLDAAMSANPNVAPNPSMARSSASAPHPTIQPQAHPKPVKRKSKPQLAAGPPQATPGDPFRGVMPSSSSSSASSASGFATGGAGLPHFASPSQLFARPQAAAPSSAAFPQPSPAVSIDPLAMRHSEEPQTPPPPQHQMLSVQESPDPLNLLSPNGHFSLWQQPVGAPLPPQPFATNGAAHHRLAAQQYDPTMARAPPTNGALAAKRKDLTPADKPKRKRSKKLKEELPHQPPAMHPPADNLQSAPLQTESAAAKPKALKLKKLVKKEPTASKYDDDDVSMMPGVTVEIPVAPGMYELSSTSSAMEPSQTTKKKKKKQRSRKSLSELVNQIVEDSDSGMDAEGSDWEGLEIIENYDPEPVPEGPKSLAKMSNGPVKSSQRKVPIAKLCGLIEDIFEADDSLPDRDSLQELLPGQSLSPAADQFFEIIESPAVGGGDSRSVLVLRAAALQKLLKLIVMCSRPHTEIASISGKAQPATNPSLGTIPAADTIRLLAILERSTRLAENIDPFPSQPNRGLASEPASPSKPKKVRKPDHRSKSTSKTPEPTQTSEHRDEDAEAQEANAAKDAGDDDRDRTPASRDSDDELEKLNAIFVVMDRAVLATECSLGMLTGDVLPKQILSEDHIRSSFEAVKACLDKVLLPFIEACSGSAATAPHPHLVSLIDVLSPQKARKKKAAAANGDEATSSIGIICRNTLSDLFAHLCSALYFVQRMVRMPSIALSDSIIISAVYIALGPFFVLEPESAGGGASSENAKAAARGRSALLSLGGANSMKTLRLPALNLLRSIFAKAPDQRQWMIEEILTSLSKLSDMKKNRRQYSLRNGKAIHSINALLLQLIQAASHGVAGYARSTADRLARGKDGQDGDEDDQTNGVSDRDGGPERMQTLEVVIEAFNATSEPDTNDAREAEIAIWRRGLEGANASARSIAGYLMQRIGQNKVAKASQEMSHAYVIESLIQDLLSALFLPEWPAAALMLSAFCRVFGSYLEDAKSHPDAKGVALEQLSLVAARLRQSQLQLQPVRDDRSSRSSNSPATPENAVGHALSEPAEDTRTVKRSRSTTWDHLSMLRALRERDREAIQEFVRTYKFISQFLAKTGNEDMSTEGALEFLLVQAEGELATAWSKVEEDMVALSNSEDGDAAQVTKLQHFREELDFAMVTLSEFDAAASSASFDAFASEDKALAQASDLSERALIASSSMIAYPVLRDLLVEGLNNPLIANRSKALRGIDRIAQVDPDLLDEDSMRSAIEVRLRDSSNAVRDSAVALFGSYLLRKPQHIPKYYKQIAARILDTGLSVRKRMVRLLKSLHEATDDPKIRIDTCARIVRCINDEDTLVQDMAVLTIGEMWLEMDIDARRLYSRRRGSPMRSTPVASQPADTADTKESDAEKIRGADGQFAAEGKRALPTVEEPIEETEADKKVADTIEIIMAVADVIKERPSPLEEVFRRLFKDKSESEAAELHAKLQRLGDSMIDSLVESSGASSIDTVKRIRIVQLLVSTNPAILTISKAKLLLPYLKAAQTSEELQIMDLLLRIFRSCLPHMPKTALAFADALEKSLRPLVNRPPPKAGLHLLQELIACYCAVIITHTHNFKLLIQTLKACFMRVQAMRQMALKGQKVEENKAWSTLMSLTASLCEHADFDDIRKKHPETTADIDALSKRPLIDVVSEALLDIHRTGSEAVRSVSLQNLGFIFRAHPTLMTRPLLTAMMDDIFASGSLQDRATLLKIILDFLSADALRRNPDNAVVTAGTGRRKPENPDAGSVDMTILVGNTETFADTGVGSAMMQRYSEDVLKATLEVSNPPLQRTAIDILRFTVLQGLSHPIQCVPYLVSLETLEDRKLRSRAMELHSHLASKHASLVQARFLDTARSAFRFQMQLGTAQALRGFRVDNMPTAVLGAWYSLLRDRRATRLDFLKQIVKALDVNTASADCSMDEVLFARFMADNLATLDYKTMEELFIVIGELRSILAVSGMQVLHNMQPHLPKQDFMSSAAQTESAQDGMRTPPPPGIAVQGGDLISPFGMSRNPWLSGEWQLQLASDATPPVGGTIDPTQIFGYSQPVATTDGISLQIGNPAPLARDDDQEPADSKTQIDPITVAKMSIISGTALLLRNHLKQLYGLSEARCAKFNPSKKQSAGADKPATMRALADPMHAALDFSAMPFGLEEVKSEEDARKQMVAYAAMVENEGTMMEPEDADGLDDLAL
ncbi:Sister chromatid cohesion protein 2 [Pseudozyma hubeiensis]|nr:Sister chromatid cohesion protein 2 [Pseudozyma hubeiensis]